MTTLEAGRFIRTAFGPALWGTTYIVFTQTLPTDYPLLISALRSLPAGMIMLLLVRRLPSLDILLPITVLAMTNVGLFFFLLLTSAARLPGGITATLAACQPLFVALLAWPLLGYRPGFRQIAIAVLGMLGVALMVLEAGLPLDAIGLLAGIGAALSMALGVVLMERWRGLASPLEMTTWQLLISGVVLLPIALMIEGTPALWDMQSLLGLTYLIVFATALAYWLWISGVQLLGSHAAVLSFLSPVVAVALGVAILHETLSLRQTAGIALVFSSIGLSMRANVFGSRLRTTSSSHSSIK